MALFPNPTEPKAIGVALSGGGTRAMAFHAGMIRYLADAGSLNQVTHVSSVSGGSLLLGLILKLAKWRWPTGEDYKGTIFPAIRYLLTERDLAAHALRSLMLPTNWRYVFSRANVVANAIETIWSIDASLADLPTTPIWSVNAATSETGRRFRFKQTNVGDYTLGYADAAEFKVADAMAVSAAYPGFIGPFVIQTGSYEWRKRETWGSLKDDAKITKPESDKIHLYDGGIYDNLGTEPLFDSGTQCAKEGVNFIIVSDAGAPLGQVNSCGFQPFRLKRVADIISEQSRALRVRSFVNFLRNNPKNGAYIQIGAHAEGKLRTYGQLNPDVAERLLRDSWISAEDAARSATYPTTLRRMSAPDFDLLTRHGYETANWNLRLFS